MVGAYDKDTDGLTDNGQVYAYKRATIDDAWTEVDKLTASDKAKNDCFGISAAITSDGLVAMVGAIYKDNDGQVYTYTTGISKDITLTIPEQPQAPTSAMIFDKSHPIAVASSSYSNGAITNTYASFSEQSRAIKRAIHIEQPNVEVIEPFTTLVNKLK